MDLHPFQIKICGVRGVPDAWLAANAGADAIGLNFVPTSPRVVDLDTAARITAAVADSVAKVGVFLNDDPSRIASLFDQLCLDAVQLHGDEQPADLAALAPRPVIKAFRCRDNDFTVVHEFLAACSLAGVVPQAVLVDAFDPQAAGGTGRQLDWPTVRRLTEQAAVPVILAGGLQPDNVGQAIRDARPAAVDVASGVECSPRPSCGPGKDRDKTLRFVISARQAFACLRQNR